MCEHLADYGREKVLITPDATGILTALNGLAVLLVVLSTSSSSDVSNLICGLAATNAKSKTTNKARILIFILF
jgi:hypothetical protein